PGPPTVVEDNNMCPAHPLPCGAATPPPRTPPASVRHLLTAPRVAGGRAPATQPGTAGVTG
ncbi:hypothetical protein ACFW3V_22840, partial [Streptomyces mutabilis]|uniref:hypothetical protein n=1 Tax=Streptomyces mutabilis TaxID=67332 RepID=UPI0036C7AB61